MVPAHVHFGILMLEKFKLFKEEIALLDAYSGAEMSYGEMAQMSVDIALSLSRIGVGKGDVICICSEKRMEFIPTMIGVLCIGATFTTADISCKNVKDFLATPVNGWCDTALILYSSGTTGQPKAVPLTHLNYILCHQHGLCNSRFTKTMMLSTREWYYTYGLNHTIGTLLVGATVVYTRDQITDYLQAIQDYKVSFIQVVPTTIRDLVNSNLKNYDVSSLICMMSTSTPIDADLVKTAKEKFPKLKQVSQMYGMTEAGCLCDDLNTPKGPKPGSVGCVNPGVVIKVVDIKTGEPVGPNETGEICFKTPSLMPDADWVAGDRQFNYTLGTNGTIFLTGYLGDLSRNYLDGEGFFKSGDIGYYDEDLYFYITHRIKDIIKYKGATMSPNEIEAVLLQYPGVREACVVAIEHRQYGEVPAAAVIADDVTAEELMTFVTEQLTSISMDGGIKFVDNLPKVEGVKLNRKAVKDLFDI
ncbi:4-coumarate--CoA ligase 1 [Papilio machaon]|uniref:4-coumarate--CoA ligase 1 n=1 Tax=Papilio machaon TaxID=76193 RepID=UPI001E665349|nr:4-coumarate--CoA ligase 1 [Papilio machaon]